MNSRFEKYLKVLQSGDEKAEETKLAELHQSFSSLYQEDQKIAEIFRHAIQRGDVHIDPDHTFRDYLTDSKAKAYFEGIEGEALPLFKVNIKAATLLKKFILVDGFELGETDSFP